MAEPTMGRSSSPSPSSNTPGFGKEGQSNASNSPPAPPSPQSSQSDDHTTSVVEGDWVVIVPSSVAGSEAPGDFSGTSGKAYDDGKHITRADVEENMVGKLAALLAEREGAVRGDIEVQELVERELGAYGVDLGMEKEGVEDENTRNLVGRRGK